MQISEIINTTLCVLSFFLAAISVISVVLTLKQNSKIIRNSTRPYIVAMAQTTNYQSPMFYLVIKNFGASGATIERMICSIDLMEVSFLEDKTPFNHIEGSFLAPGQKIICSLDPKEFKRKGINDFTVNLKYSDGLYNYSESYPINYKAYMENVNVRASTEGKELKTISYTLQDLVEKEF